MCPSTPASRVAIVSLEHSAPGGSHSCWVTLHIQDECGCVRRISHRFYRTGSRDGHHWVMNQEIPQIPCAAHVEQTATLWAARLQASRGSIPAMPTQLNSSAVCAESAPQGCRGSTT